MDCICYIRLKNVHPGQDNVHLPCFLLSAGSILAKSVGICCTSINGCKDSSWNHARETKGGKYDDKFVDGTISVLRVLPVFGLIIVYWAVYNQVGRIKRNI